MKRSDGCSLLACVFENIHRVGTAAMNDALPRVPTDITAYSGYNVVGGGYEDQIACIGDRLRCVTDVAVRHEPGELLS